MIGLASFIEGYRRLVAAYGRTFREDQAAEYHKAIGHRVELHEWQQVVTVATQECDSFPPIKTLLGIHYHQRRQQRQGGPVADDPDGGETCPDCHAGRMVLLLDNGVEQIEWDHRARCRFGWSLRGGAVIAKEYPNGNGTWRREEVA